MCYNLLIVPEIEAHAFCLVTPELPLKCLLYKSEGLTFRDPAGFSKAESNRCGKVINDTVVTVYPPFVGGCFQRRLFVCQFVCQQKLPNNST